MYKVAFWLMLYLYLFSQGMIYEFDKVWRVVIEVLDAGK